MADKTEPSKAVAAAGKSGKPVEAAKPASSAAAPAKSAAVAPPVKPVSTPAAKVAAAPATPPVKAAAPAKPAPAAAPATKSAKAGTDPARSVPAKPVATPAPAEKPVATKPTSPVAVKPAPEAAKSAPERVTAQAPKIKSAPEVKAEEPAPIEAAAPKRGRPPKQSSVEEPAPTMTHTAEPAPVVATSEGSKTMNETVTKAQESVKKVTSEAAGFTQEAAGRTQALFGEITERAKSSYEKGVQLAEELTEFSKGNVEAFVESSKVAAKGVESLSQEAADYARKTLESSTAAFKTFASVKSPTEFFRLQSDYAKSYFDNAVAESSKVTEAWLKLAGDVAQPLSNRYAVAVEKIKLAAA